MKSLKPFLSIFIFCFALSVGKTLLAQTTPPWGPVNPPWYYGYTDGNKDYTTYPNHIVELGDIYCSDGTIVPQSEWPVGGKTAVGVVFFVDPTGVHGWAVHKNEIGAAAMQPQVDLALNDFSAHRNITTPFKGAMYDTASYTNILHMKTYNTSTYTGYNLTNSFKLPTAQQWNVLYGAIPEVNASLAKIGGTLFGSGVIPWYYWTSTENGANAWYAGTYSDGTTVSTMNITTKTNAGIRTRGVIEFNIP